ncbi:sel1 repeat family protein [Alphaproteobacteria bacterium]|nr:sel1 repeat family protein [Alphaproteobacteria bacterium]
MTALKNALSAITNKDYNTAIKILLPIAENGNASADFYLGYLYFNGLGVIANEKQANKFRLSAAKIFKEQAENGNNEAISKLGRILADSSQLDNTDFLEELKWLKLASSNGCREASFMLGNIYNTGHKINDTNESDFFPIINKKEAFKWFKISAEQGMAFGMINVASFLRLGTGVELDLKDAFKWYNIAVLSYKKMINYRFADVWENEVIPGSKEHIREIKRSLKSTEIFEIVKIANEYVRQKTEEGVFDYSSKDDLDDFLDFINNVD